MSTYGLSITETARRADDFARQVMRELSRVAKTTAAELDPVAPSMVDLIPVRSRWGRAVDDALLPVIERDWLRAANELWRQLADAAPEADRLDVGGASGYVALVRSWLLDVGGELYAAMVAELHQLQRGDVSHHQVVTGVSTAAQQIDKQTRAVARTISAGAANAGAYAQVIVSGLDGEKTWRAVDDDASRPSHAALSGTSLPLTEDFLIDGEYLSGPHDPHATATQVMSCRCVLGFELPTVQPVAESVVAAADSEQTGAMIALVPSDADAARLAQPGGEPQDELHLTLFVIGEAADFTPVQRADLTLSVAHMLDALGPSVVQANAFGVGYWNPEGPEPSWVLNVGDDSMTDGDGLMELHEMLGQCCPGDMPDQFCPWVPHVCVAYSIETSWLDTLAKLTGPITFDRVRVAFGPDVTDITLA